MSYFVCPNCKHESHIFGSDGTKNEAQRQNLSLLGSIPLNEKICLQSDLGKPVLTFDDDETLTRPYHEIAHKVLKFTNGL